MEKESDHINSTQDVDNQHDVVDPIDAMDEQSAAKEKLTGNDPNKIKFTAVSLGDSKNGDAKVDIHLVHTTIGMGKEELMKYANEPFWIRLRLFLFILFWVGWIAMLVGAVIIILVAPRCPPAPRLDWYQKNSMYQVDVRSFKDSNGDGVGDLPGLLSALEYFKNINVKTLLLSGIYPITQTTINGVLNHTDIDSRVGTMADMDDFMAEAKRGDFKIILDFIPNESSKEHPWFKASLEGDEAFKDYYVWADAPSNGDEFPNNWLGVDDRPAWTHKDQRSQYYFHTFSSEEPELNLRNDDVKRELWNILKFWLDKGVDGFKVHHASHLVEDLDLKDEPLGTASRSEERKYTDMAHAFTVDQPENYELFAEWKELLNNYSASTGSKKIFLAVLSGNINGTLKYFGNKTNVLVDFPINTDLTKLTEDSSPLELMTVLESWIAAVKNIGWPNWMIGNEDTKRLAERFGPDLIDGIHMVAMLTEGTPITYYGDELGLTKSPAPGATFLMPWVNETAGGSNSDRMDVEAQLVDTNSHLKIFSRVAELRNQPAVNFGFQKYPVVTDSIFSMIRVRKGSPGYLVILNMSPNATVVDLLKNNTVLPEKGRVEIRSRNIVSGELVKVDHPKINLDSIPMGPKQSAVLSFVPKLSD